MTGGEIVAAVVSVAAIAGAVQAIGNASMQKTIKADVSGPIATLVEGQKHLGESMERHSQNAERHDERLREVEATVTRIEEWRRDRMNSGGYPPFRDAKGGGR